MTTTKKIDAVNADGLAAGPLCPMLGTCITRRCALYSDDARACVLSPDGLHLLLRTAITDAAVEISHHMGDDRK